MNTITSVHDGRNLITVAVSRLDRETLKRLRQWSRNDRKSVAVYVGAESAYGHNINDDEDQPDAMIERPELTRYADGTEIATPCEVVRYPMTSRAWVASVLRAAARCRRSGDEYAKGYAMHELKRVGLHMARAVAALP